MRLYLIRHGLTPMNEAHVIDSYEPGAELSEAGRLQAEALVHTLRDVDFDAIYVSSIVRTQQTAAPLANHRGLTPRIDRNFREIEAGSWEGGASHEDYMGYLGTIQTWLSGDLDARMGGGVTGREVLERYDAGVRAIEESGARTVALVSHGGVIGFWAAARGIGITPEDVLWERHLKNTSFAIVEGSLDAGYRAISWADHVF